MDVSIQDGSIVHSEGIRQTWRSVSANEEVEELIASRVLAPLPAKENEGKSGENTQKQNPRQGRPKRKLTEEESKDAGKYDDGKGTMNNRKKRQGRRKEFEWKIIYCKLKYDQNPMLLLSNTYLKSFQAIVSCIRLAKRFGDLSWLNSSPASPKSALEHI